MPSNIVLTSRRRAYWLKVLRQVPMHAFLLLVAFVMLAPLIWMFSTSLKTVSQVYSFPPEWIPRPVAWENYPNTFATAPFHLFLLNSFKVAGSVTFGTLFISSLAAYAFARIRFPGKNIAFGILLATMMIPYTVRVIPMYAMFRTFGFIDRHIALILPPIVSNIFGVFLLRQFFMSLPYDLDEAARIDGCTSLGIWWRIMLPLSKPALATLGLFTFRTAWNQFLPALIFINSSEKALITVGLTIFRGEYTTEWHLMMAASALAVLPMLIIYLSAQKYFVKGIALTGIKG